MRRWTAALALALSAPALAEVHCAQGSTCIDTSPGFETASSYTATGDWIFDAASNDPITCTDGIKDSTLTAGRILFAGTAGRIDDVAGLTWTAGSTLVTVPNLTVTGDTTPTGLLMLPMGETAYFNITGTAVTIGSQTTDCSTNMVLVSVASATNGHHEFDNGGANTGRLRYTGTVTKTCHIAMTFSVSTATNNDNICIAVARNGAVLSTSPVIMRPGLASDTDSSAIHVMATLATNQYLEMYVGNLTGARNVTVKSVNLFAMCMQQRTRAAPSPRVLRSKGRTRRVGREWITWKSGCGAGAGGSPRRSRW